jgi:hypothetical protein
VIGVVCIVYERERIAKADHSQVTIEYYSSAFNRMKSLKQRSDADNYILKDSIRKMNKVPTEYFQRFKK